MDISFEDDIEDDEKTKVIAAVLSAKNAASEAGLSFPEIAVDTTNKSMLAKAAGKKWYCKETSSTTMLCRDKPW